MSDPASPDALAVIDMDLARLSEAELPATPDEILLLRGRLEEIKRGASDRLKLLDDGVLKTWLKAHGGSVTAGTNEFYIGQEKKVKVNDLKAAIIALYEATGGDFDAFVSALSVNALKPGESKKLLGTRFDKLFTTTMEGDVKVKCLDKRFLK